MKVEQIYTGCLAQGAYYIESDGVAAIIDPLREVQPYLEKAKKNNAKVKYVLETHFHADFVSGHLDPGHRVLGCILYCQRKILPSRKNPGCSDYFEGCLKSHALHFPPCSYHD